MCPTAPHLFSLLQHYTQLHQERVDIDEHDDEYITQLSVQVSRTGSNHALLQRLDHSLPILCLLFTCYIYRMSLLSLVPIVFPSLTTRWQQLLTTPSVAEFLVKHHGAYSTLIGTLDGVRA